MFSGKTNKEREREGYKEREIYSAESGRRKEARNVKGVITLCLRTLPITFVLNLIPSNLKGNSDVERERDIKSKRCV